MSQEAQGLLSGAGGASSRYAERVEAGKRTGCRDPLWAVLFLAQVAAIIAVGIWLFVKNKADILDHHGAGDGGFSVGTSTILLGVSVLALGILSAGIFLGLLQKRPELVLKVSLFFMPTLWAGLAVWFLLNGALGAGLAVLFMAGVFLLFLYFFWDRFATAVMTLRMATTVIRDYPAALVTGVAGLVAMAAWSLVWLGCTMFIALEYANRDKDGNITDLKESFAGPMTGLVFSYYWTANTLNYIVHATVAGLMAAWYYGVLGDKPTWNSFKRASFLSLGSIALASLLIAVVQTVRWMVHQMRRRSENSIAICLLDCCLSCIEGLMQIFNKYTLVYVAVYGDDFCTAGSKVFGLMSSRAGLMTLVNDNFVGAVLTFGSLLGGASTSLLAMILARFAFGQEDYWVWALVGFLVGFVLAMCVLAVVDSAVCTLFVCIAEDADTFRRLHGHEYAEWCGISEDHRHAVEAAPVYGDGYQTHPGPYQYA